MSGDVHVRFCESRGVRFPPATHLVVLCTTEQQAQAAYDWLVATLNGLKLECHPDKTRVVHLADGSQGFDFLGFHFRRLPSWRRRGHWTARNWPSRQAMTSIRARIKEVTAPRAKLHLQVEDIVKELNPVVRGWGVYFKRPGTGRQMAQIDQYVKFRLALFVRKKLHLWEIPGSCAATLPGQSGSVFTNCLRPPQHEHPRMPKEQRSSESRVRENRMHGSMGGGWKRSVRHRASRLPYRTGCIRRGDAHCDGARCTRT